MKENFHNINFRIIACINGKKKPQFKNMTSLFLSYSFIHGSFHLLSNDACDYSLIKFIVLLRPSILPTSFFVFIALKVAC